MSDMANSSRGRQLEPHWNPGMIAASIAISLLGAFTSTQLMCQAKVSLHFFSVLVWTTLGSLTFGFCSIWSLHFVAMLACELDLQIGINVPLTLLSAILAVFFTFAALASDLVWDRYKRESRKRKKLSNRKRVTTRNIDFRSHTLEESASRPLLDSLAQEDNEYGNLTEDGEVLPRRSRSLELDGASSFRVPRHNFLSLPKKPFHGESEHDLPLSPVERLHQPLVHVEENYPETVQADEEVGLLDSTQRTSSDHSISGRSSSLLGSNSTSSYGLGAMMNIAYRSTSQSKNAFLATKEALYAGCTRKNILKGFLWSLAITSMHYVGIAALVIPGDGSLTFNPLFLILSALISWIVCLVGAILMASMETHLTQQFFFSAVATLGVAAMHFTGMRAVTFWSQSPPTDKRGYPSALAIAIVSIAVTTCIAANGLLAHAATVSRNKLADVVWTRRKLWRTIAQKENAEAAAAARSDFIASASHEIRTPLHHLQGYSDLLSQTELTEEGRLLLSAIQRATKTLSLITNNVLDWSKLERDAEAVCRPVSLDMRIVCESILVLLPNKDDEADVDLMVVVTPDVPHSLFLDETYIHRVLMNLLSNALKFTRAGYVLLLVEIKDGKLVATVKDTGTGVPPSFLPQLFEPFKQATTLGSQRGTGLGLSIVKQLLHKMEGSIEVESKHPETEDVEARQTGSTFTISIPVHLPTSKNPSAKHNPRIAIFPSNNERSLEGLSLAWEKFEFDVTIVKEYSELADVEWKYIWADLAFLIQNPVCLQQLLRRDNCLVLIPFDTQETLHRLPTIVSATHFVPLQKPLIWHSFQQRIQASQQPGNELSRMVRFASKVDIVDDQEQVQERTAKNLTILLVEDNPINLKLGKKMLIALGYQVLTAEDGSEAIEQLTKHDGSIDAILMDQSMPRKDGVTATREIRGMEAKGMLLRKRRPIIAVTAVVNSQAQALFKSAGADDFLAKPLSLEKLEKTLAAHLPTSFV